MSPSHVNHEFLVTKKDENALFSLEHHNQIHFVCLIRNNSDHSNVHGSVLMSRQGTAPTSQALAPLPVASSMPLLFISTRTFLLGSAQHLGFSSSQESSHVSFLASSEKMVGLSPLKSSSKAFS